MKGSIRDWKAQARENLSGWYSTLILALLLEEAINLLLTWIFTGNNNTSSTIIGIATVIIALLAVVMNAGYHAMFLNIARGRDARVGDIFYCFTTHPDHVIEIGIIQLLLECALLAPMLIFSNWFMSMSSLRIIFTAQLSWGSFTIRQLPPRALAFYLLILAVWLVIVIAVNLRFALVYEVYIDDPSLNPFRAFGRSSRLMKGYRWKMVGLYLSFIGLYLLSILSLGLGFLWTLPYLRMTRAQMYIDLSGK